MWTLNRLREDPQFVRAFAFVHPLCWPVLFWQLIRLLKWMNREGYPEVVYNITRWGFVRIRLLGDKSGPSAYKPIERTFRPLTDACWGSDLPCALRELAQLETLRLAPILARAREGSVMAPTAMTQGALIPNTS